MAFKLPRLLPGNQRTDSSYTPADLVDLQVYDYQEINILHEVGRGTFSTVYVASRNEETFVAKVLRNIEDEGKEIFIKEARLLHACNHPNIVQFKGICKYPPVLLFQYFFFDFCPFRRDLRVSTLKSLLKEIDDFQWKTNFKHFVPIIALEVTKGLLYLHKHDIVHRDLKLDNILVSNQHYCSLKDENQIENYWMSSPVKCKLTDFGESRSNLIKTQSLMATSTNHLQRGTPSFMAPEISLPELIKLKCGASMDDLKKVDVWALGMVFYILLNPRLSTPYKYDLLQNGIKPNEYLIHIQNMMREKKRPTSLAIYKDLHCNEWSEVFNTYLGCTSFVPKERPDAEMVLHLLYKRLL